MRQLPADKYNVAWFKLAEFVVRGEKERALGLYRLLIHSFDDKALAAQLEGDLLLAFNDESAVLRYEEAAYTYYKTERYVEAIAMFETLLNLKPYTENYIKKIVFLYQETGQEQKAYTHMVHLACKYVECARIDDALELLMQPNHYTPHELLALYIQVITRCIQEQKSKSSLMIITERITRIFMEETDPQILQRFLSDIKERDAELYEHICISIKNN